ncbi:serine hydrolase domain-containing protein [Salipaludibacillus aurantiacus]|uniref:CubicO group peptidase, beta-lactamase class C family n=1 Tax=Salipaludibacillus aurantiacus TaxID=1601833 RepID=A0A1H9W2H0_9BACI|nr:serine hydrolase domain-containing protein [Salipaludibacillus aurantiacus]SES28126.1 CubicO group peptidase, beta-lactamase class C family [Salipaludibacillus aurantiacus]
MAAINEALLNNVLNGIANKKGVYSAVLCVEKGDNSFSWTGAAGVMQKDSRYFIASVTKLYVTSVVMRLIEEGRLQLDDPIERYLPEEYMKGLHVLKEVDYSQAITVKHLISNTSGLPDYFFHKQPDGSTFASKLLEGKDISMELEETVTYVKELTPKFPPGKNGKAAYSDTNYQLLGRIIEVITEKQIGDVFKEYLFDELQLEHTYAYKDTSDTAPVPFYYKSKELWVPNYMASITAEGGIVSTAEESMLFIKNFFKGQFFPEENIEHLKKWNLILPPPSLFFYGLGLEKLFTPRFISPFKPISEIVGFWGQTGSFAWYHPETDLYFTGTTNQINGAGHTAAMRGMLKIIKAAL